jgi:phage replication O-like protein O
MSASPQVEDGYIKIANELFDAILRFPFTARQLKVVLAIVRKTYGFNKKRDDISASQIGEICGMARTHVTNTLNELARKNVISKVKGEYGSMVEITKDYTRWDSTESVLVASTKSVHLPYQIGTCTESVQGVSNSLIIQEGCTDPVQVYQNGTSTESVQVASTDSVHTKDNLPKDIKHSRVKKSAEVVDEEFEEAWRLYPKRDGGNSKTAARKAWDTRRREGIAAASMIEGVKRYAKQVADAGNVGTRFVKMASTFFGPDHHFDVEPDLASAPTDAVGPSWWRRAGFEKEWQATNEGCSERYAHLWRNGKRVTDGALA